MRMDLLGKFFALEDGIGVALSGTAKSLYVRWRVTPSKWEHIGIHRKQHVTHEALASAEVITPQVAHELAYLRRRSV